MGPISLEKAPAEPYAARLLLLLLLLLLLHGQVEPDTPLLQLTLPTQWLTRGLEGPFSLLLASY